MNVSCILVGITSGWNQSESNRVTEVFFFETKRVKEAIDEEANQIIEMHLHAVAAAHSLFGLLLN